MSNIDDTFTILLADSQSTCDHLRRQLISRLKCLANTLMAEANNYENKEDYAHTPFIGRSGRDIDDMSVSMVRERRHLRQLKTLHEEHKHESPADPIAPKP